TPVVQGKRVWTLGTMGDLRCLDTANGELIWSKNLPTEYRVEIPQWGFAGHPLLDGQKLICLVGGEGSVAVAFDKDTGKELWRALSAREPGYCPPTMITVAGKRQVVVWDPEAVNALDLETGKVLWTQPWAVRMGLSVATPRQAGDLLLLTAFYNGTHLFRLGETSAELLWQSERSTEKNTDKLHSLMSTPFVDNGTIY